MRLVSLLQMTRSLRRKCVTMLILICLCPTLYVLVTHAKRMLLDVDIGADDRSAQARAAPKQRENRFVKHSPPKKPPRKEGPEKGEERRAPPMKRVLIVTYGRSGSTFTSYILKEVPKAYYFYEPLRPLLMRFTSGMDIIMNYTAIGGTHMKPQEPSLASLSSYERKALQVMEGVLTCDISKFPVIDYHSNHFRLHGDAAKVSNCLWKMVKDSYRNLSRYLQCLMDFWHACFVSPLRIFKVIRLPVRSLFHLMRKFPDLHVVYLVRDPRAILFSQRTVFGHAPRAEDFCKMVVDDAAHMRLLQEIFPSRSVAVRYEDISNEPQEWTRRLYKALNLPLTSKVKARVRKMTSTFKISKDANYSSFRADSKKAANKWRTSIQFETVRADDAVCKTAYDWLGYKTVLIQTVLRNLTVSLVESTEKLRFL